MTANRFLFIFLAFVPLQALGQNLTGSDAISTQAAFRQADSITGFESLQLFGQQMVSLPAPTGPGGDPNLRPTTANFLQSGGPEVLSPIAGVQSDAPVGSQFAAPSGSD